MLLFDGEEYQDSEKKHRRSADAKFDPMPEGSYKARISKIDYVRKTDERHHLKIEFVVFNSDLYTGRHLWDYVVLKNPSEAAVHIGYQKLKSIAFAAGHPDPMGLKDSDELVGKNVVLTVGIEKSEQFGEQNKIKEYLFKYEHKKQEKQNPLYPRGRENLSGISPNDDIPF